MEMHASNPYVYVGYVCSVCKTHKGETNHWKVIVPNDTGYTVCNWDTSLLHIQGSRPICGQACLAREVSQKSGTIDLVEQAS